MRARPQVEPLVAALALAAAIAAVAWWTLSDEEVLRPGPPSYKGAPVEIVTASMPQIPIRDFEREFNVNDENPFVPLLQRVAESRKIRQNRTAKPTPTSKPPQVEEVPIPQLNFPALAARRADAPSCIGVVGSAQGETLLVRLPGSTDTLSIVVGEAVPRDQPADQQWTLVALEPGGIARFRDPTGTEQLFSIGLLPTAIAAPHVDAAPKTQTRTPPATQTPPATAPPMRRPGATPTAQPPPGGWAPQIPHPRGWTPRPPSEVPPPTR